MTRGSRSCRERWACLESADAANRRHAYGRIGAGAPYALSQLTGAYVTIPDFLDGEHRVASKTDADAYLSRLAAFATAMDQELDTVRHDAALGCTPPDFLLARTCDQMRKLRAAPPRDCGLVLSCGAVPQAVLDSVVDRYIEASRV
jgi:uncharacterized protein (DUF885 family)